MPEHEQKPRILLVDDAPVNTMLLEQALPEYETMTADNGHDAVVLADSFSPDLILLDIQMPVMDGFAVCEHLQQDPKTAAIPVIFLTGMAEPGYVAKGFQVGAVDYITKPFDFTEVKARIKTQLALRWTRQQLEAKNRDLKETIREQQINAGLARRILSLINGPPPRYTNLAGYRLFCWAFSTPCRLEGGDHFLIRTVNRPAGGAKTVISLKDQSGHSVNCLLRSIITDLFHNSILAREPAADAGQVFSRLNEHICRAAFYADDDFCTAINLEVDHETMELHFADAGHPAFFLIRDGQVRLLPDPKAPINGLPLAALPTTTYDTASIQLRGADKLLLYTDGLNDLGRERAYTLAELHTALTAIVQDRPALSAAALGQQLLTNLGAYDADSGSIRQQLKDDISLLALEIEEPPAVQPTTFYPRDYENFDTLCAAAHELLPAELRRDDRVGMAFREALVNAWRHGNHKDPQRGLHIRCWQHNDYNLEITDEGEGFPPEEIPDPLTVNHLQDQSGRGIFIMRRYSAWVDWQLQGRRVTLAFPGHPWTQPPDRPAVDLSLWNFDGIVSCAMPST